MTEPGGIQREPSSQVPGPSGTPSAPSPTDRPAPLVELKKCPHCDKSLAAQDVTAGRCWFCEKKLTDPVQPKQPRAPFVATVLFGFLGAILGMVIGLVLLGEKNGLGSWTVSLCGGLGFAGGSAIARSVFGRRK